MRTPYFDVYSAATREDRGLRFFSSGVTRTNRGLRFFSSGATHTNRGLRFFPFSTRRPLFAALSVLAAAIWITILLLPRKFADYEPYRGEIVQLTGTICGLEEKLEGDSTVWRMVLTEVRLEADGNGSAAPTVTAAPAVTESRGVGDASKTISTSRSSDFTFTGLGRGGAGPLALNKRDRILCVLEQEPHVDLSARVRLRGKLYPFRGAMNEGEFDLRGYYHILRIAFSLRDAELLAASAPADRLAAVLFHFKNHLSSIIDRLFSSENSPVLKAMLLGEKGLLEEETRELYQGAGIIHILSISGLHLSLLGMGLFSLTGKCRFIPMPVRAAISITAVLLYGKMIGMGTSVFRALVMLILYLLSKVIGRTYDILTAASIAAILLLLDQPLYLLHTGFQFSFGAVLAIGILLPALPGRILKAVAIPLATLPVYLWAYGTFPLPSLILNLIVIPLMTAVMLSAGGAVLVEEILFTFLTGRQSAAGASTFLQGIPRLLGLPAELILDFYRFLAESSKKIPGHEIVFGRPSPVRILLFYGMLLILAAVSVRLQMPHMRRRIEAAAVSFGPGDAPQMKNSNWQNSGLSGSFFTDPESERNNRDAAGEQKSGLQKGRLHNESRADWLLRQAAQRTCRFFRLQDNHERKNFACLLIGLWMTAALLILTAARRTPAFEMDLLYVGQGDGIFISCQGRHFLIDGGSSSKEELAKYTLLPFFHCRGISRLDGILLTHDDGDHCSGILELLEAAAGGDPQIQVSTIYLPDIADEAKGDHYRRIENLAAQAGIPVRYISRGQRIRSGALTLDCLHPASGASYENANEYSTTLLLRYGDTSGKSEDFTALLTGDLEGQGEADLLQYLEETNVLQPANGQLAEMDLLQAANGKYAETDLFQTPDRRQNVHVLKVAHHGSKNATSEDFLQIVHPGMAMISAGIDNMYGHPSGELLDRLAASISPSSVFRTDLQGEITIRRRKGDNYHVKCFLEASKEMPGTFAGKKPEK